MDKDTKQLKKESRHALYLSIVALVISIIGLIIRVASVL